MLGGNFKHLQVFKHRVLGKFQVVKFRIFPVLFSNFYSSFDPTWYQSKHRSFFFIRKTPIFYLCAFQTNSRKKEKLLICPNQLQLVPTQQPILPPLGEKNPKIINNPQSIRPITKPNLPELQTTHMANSKPIHHTKSHYQCLKVPT